MHVNFFQWTFVFVFINKWSSYVMSDFFSGVHIIGSLDFTRHGMGGEEDETVNFFFLFQLRDIRNYSCLFQPLLRKLQAGWFMWYAEELCVECSCFWDASATIQTYRKNTVHMKSSQLCVSFEIVWLVQKELRQ